MLNNMGIKDVSQKHQTPSKSPGALEGLILIQNNIIIYTTMYLRLNGNRGSKSSHIIRASYCNMISWKN